MSKAVSLPGEWEQQFDRVESDSFVDREYTTPVSVHSATGRRVVVSDVQEPNGFEGWRYLVQVLDPQYGELGLVDDLGTARDVAFDFTDSHAEYSE